MKKKIFAYLLLMLPALLLTSCLKDQEDVFDKPASIRTKEYLEKTRRVLTSSEHGWVLDMFPHPTQDYGGYSFTMKFDEDNVTVCTELAEDVTEPITSAYTLSNEAGPVLCFDTYNKYLHLFSTPSSGTGAGGYEAYKGDFLFIIMNISEDENTITLKGTRSGNLMYMHRITQDIADYQTELNEFVSNLVFDRAVATIDGKEYTLNFFTNDRYIGIDVPEGEEAIETAFCFDNNGFTLYEPATLSGKQVQVFKYNEENATFTSQEDPSVVFTGLLLPSIVINNVGESVSVGNSASTLEYHFNLADKFTYTANDSWLKVSVSGKDLKIDVEENTTGEPRSGTITVEASGEKATITVSQVPLNRIFADSDLYFAFSKFSAALQPTYMACKTLSDSEGEVINVMAFTTYNNPTFATGFGIYFTSGNYAGLIALDLQFIGGDKVKFVYNSARNDLNGNGGWYYSHGYSTFINYLTSTTFTLTADSELQPTYFTLTDDNNSANYFTVVTKAVSTPFNN